MHERVNIRNSDAAIYQLARSHKAGTGKTNAYGA